MQTCRNCHSGRETLQGHFSFGRDFLLLTSSRLKLNRTEILKARRWISINDNWISVNVVYVRDNGVISSSRLFSRSCVMVSARCVIFLEMYKNSFYCLHSQEQIKVKASCRREERIFFRSRRTSPLQHYSSDEATESLLAKCQRRVYAKAIYRQTACISASRARTSHYCSKTIFPLERNSWNSTTH